MNRTEFHLKQLEPLIGGTVVSLARSGVDPELGDEFFGLVIQLKNGQKKSLMLLSDDEGNGPGSFEINDA